ncbi:MAG: hypothetical protein Q7J56_01895 [Deltaproteobacteria bacterium]|nr:hypothetical protein [Deltaproteobacteria bacterium]
MSLVFCLDPACEICEAQRQGLMVPPRVAEEIIDCLAEASVIRVLPPARGGRSTSC